MQSCVQCFLPVVADVEAFLGVLTATLAVTAVVPRLALVVVHAVVHAHGWRGTRAYMTTTISTVRKSRKNKNKNNNNNNNNNNKNNKF
jgi:hypothetical protein